MLGWFYLFSCLCVYVLKWCAVLCSCFGLMAIYLLAWAELGIAARAWGTLTRFFPLYLSIFITSNTNRFGWGLCVEARPLATVLTLCGAVGVLAPPFAYIDFKVWLMNACLFSTPTDPRRPRQRVVTAIHHTFTQLRVGSCRRLCLRFWRWSEDGGAVIWLYASGGNLGLHLGIVSAVRFSVIGTV